jgi:CDP-glycerol glycerophosphotransferase
MTGPAAPLISIVLPVGDVAEFLPACLDSVLGDPLSGDLVSGDLVSGDPLPGEPVPGEPVPGEPVPGEPVPGEPVPGEPEPGGLEVIAVDDASADGCGRILDDRASRDPRLRVVHLAESVGPGPARMRGLAEAAGSYVWFVDPDDLLAGGALAAVAGALARGRPDVMLIDYLILHGSGRTEPSPGAALLAAPPAAAGGAITLAERPVLVNRTMTVWSKVFRREFLVGLQVCFPPGIHEDVPVSCAALLGAERIVLLGRVCYLYRRRRRSFLATTSMGHFSIFSSYEQVFARLDAGAGSAGGAQVRAALFGRSIEHYSTVLASGLIPRRARREFFHRMTAEYHRYRPPGYRRPPGLRGLKFALIERGAYGAYLVLGPLNSARVAVARARPARPRVQEAG